MGSGWANRYSLMVCFGSLSNLWLDLHIWQVDREGWSVPCLRASGDTISRALFSRSMPSPETSAFAYSASSDIKRWCLETGWSQLGVGPTAEMFQTACWLKASTAPLHPWLWIIDSSLPDNNLKAQSHLQNIVPYTSLIMGPRRAIKPLLSLWQEVWAGQLSGNSIR